MSRDSRTRGSLRRFQCEARANVPFGKSTARAIQPPIGGLRLKPEIHRHTGHCASIWRFWRKQSPLCFGGRGPREFAGGQPGTRPREHGRLRFSLPARMVQRRDRLERCRRPGAGTSASGSPVGPRRGTRQGSRSGHYIAHCAVDRALPGRGTVRLLSSRDDVERAVPLLLGASAISASATDCSPKWPRPAARRNETLPARWSPVPRGCC